MNQSTADFVLSSKLMEQEYTHAILDYSSIAQERHF
jgi:methylglyoxal synthase